MKDQRKTEAKVGVTVIAAVLLLLWIIGWAKNFSFSSNRNTVHIEFKNASGLEVGDYITVNGVREGNVENIKIENDKVMVTASLNNQIKLRKDATFSIQMVDLMGGKKIEVNPGISNQPLDYSKIQEGSFSSDIPAVMSLVGSMQDDIVSTLKEVKISLTSLNNYLTDKKFNSNIKQSINNLSELTSKLNLMIDENRNGVKQLLTSGVELTNETKDFIDKNKGEMASGLKEANKILAKTDSLMTKLNEFTNEIKNKKNNIGKFIYDKQFYTNLTQTIKQVDELTGLLVEQLKKEGLKVDAKIHLF